MSKVYFADERTGAQVYSQLDRLEGLFYVSGIQNAVCKGDRVAIKVHFGERGNTRYLRPCFVRKVVDLVRELGGQPFVTDTTILYGQPPTYFKPRKKRRIPSRRGTVEEYLETAAMNGFSPETMGCPIVIGDEQGGVETEICGNELKKFEVAKAIAESDALIVLTHVNRLAAGCIKNVGVGCATKKGKGYIHKPRTVLVDASKCTGCVGLAIPRCVEVCPIEDAIRITGDKAVIDYNLCLSCGICIDHQSVCPVGALSIPKEKHQGFCIRIADGCAAVLGLFDRSKIGFIDFLREICPYCDCAVAQDVPVIQDVGILASTDPCALEMCVTDLVLRSPSLPNSLLEGVEAERRFEILGVEPLLYVRSLENLNLGFSSKYELVELTGEILETIL